MNKQQILLTIAKNVANNVTVNTENLDLDAQQRYNEIDKQMNVEYENLIKTNKDEKVNEFVQKLITEKTANTDNHYILNEMKKFFRFYPR
jgi:hypothetical protein